MNEEVKTVTKPYEQNVTEVFTYARLARTRCLKGFAKQLLKLTHLNSLLAKEQLRKL
jgi:hypothetical protein